MAVSTGIEVNAETAQHGDTLTADGTKTFRVMKRASTCTYSNRSPSPTSIQLCDLHECSDIYRLLTRNSNTLHELIMGMGSDN